VEIAEGDAVTDSAEAFYLMKQRGIENVVVVGVAANMCVLGRPFGIRQLVQQGMKVVLVRDLTDTMYNPAKAPFVSHFTGTDLVVEHIERHWCPTVTSVDFLGGKEFRFKEDTRPHLVIVAAEDEYRTEESLPAFALSHLGKNYRTTMVYADVKDRTRLPGNEIIDEADALLLSVRRRPLNEAILARIRRFLEAGKPLVAIRTSSHAFAVRPGEKVPEGGAQWPEFDAEILGGNYQGHYPEAMKTTVQVVPEAAKHPILEDVRTDAFPVATSLYKTSPLKAGTTVLMQGTVEGKPAEPVAWVRELPGKGKVFYTSLGGVSDFKDPAVTRMLANGVRWAVGKQ
jgi:type 1 glutamine amidotransferase